MNIKMIKNTENISKEKITLFCLPFAGGGASAYNQWAKKMQGKVTVCPVQLPGREEQIMEKPYIDMSVMLDDLEEAVRKVVYGPYALWGHSMGGKIAYCMDMDAAALPLYDASEPHRTWKEKFGPLLDGKTIFDHE